MYSSVNPKRSSKIPIERIWNVGCFLILFGTIFALSSRTVADPDLWGHLRFGLDMLETKDIIQVDPYSYLTTGQTWINHEWLAELIFALSWIAVGSIGLQLLNLGICSLTFTFAFIYLTRQGIKPLRITILLIPSLILLSPAILTIRPQIFSYFLFVTMIIIIFRVEQGNIGWLWITPFIMGACFNLHGGFLAGLGILILWGFLHLIVNRHLWKKVIPPLLACVVATFINPYGMDLVIFLLRTATVSRPEIVDWQPLAINSFMGIFYLLSLVISVLGLVFSRRRHSVVMIILFSILILLPLIAKRHLQLTAIAIFLIAGEHIWDSWDRALSRVKREKQDSSWVAFLPLITAIAIILFLTPNFKEIMINVDNSYYPVDNVALLKQAGSDGNLVINFEWGEYAIWHLGPRIKVSIDGRRETVYSSEIYEKYKNFRRGVDNWDALLSDYAADIVLIDKSSPTYNLLVLRSDWQVVHEDNVSVLFVPTDSILQNSLQSEAKNLKPSSDMSSFP